MPDSEQCAGNDEVLPVTYHNEHVLTKHQPSRSFLTCTRSVYPAIDPEPLCASQAYNGNVELVIGAIAWDRAGHLAAVHSGRRGAGNSRTLRRSARRDEARDRRSSTEGGGARAGRGRV